MNRWVSVLSIAVALPPALAERPVETPAAGAPGSIAVPAPVRGGPGGIQFDGTSAGPAQGSVPARRQDEADGDRLGGQQTLNAEL